MSSIDTTTAVALVHAAASAGSDRVTLVAAAMGAFLGSGSAFLLQAWWARQQEDDRRYTALLQTQTVLGLQLNTLMNLQQGYLDKHRDDPERHMKLVPLNMAMTDLRIDLSALSFLWRIVDDDDVAGKLYIAEQGYVTATSTLALTNGLIQKVRFDHGIPLGPIDMESGVRVGQFDPGMVKVLKDTVDGLYESVDGAADEHRVAIDRLRCVMKRAFPRRIALKSTAAPEQSDAAARASFGPG